MNLKTRNKKHQFSRVFVLTLVATMFVMLSAKNCPSDSERLKAKYYYTQGAINEAEEKFDKAYEYYKKAYQSDSSFSEAAYSFGTLRFHLREDTFTSESELYRNLSLMKPYLDAYPKDVVAAESYAYIAGMADTLPEAIRVYERLVQDNPGLSKLYLPQSYYYMALGEKDKAVQAVREFERLEGPSSETLIRKVTYHLSEQDTLAALKEADLYVEALPGQPEPLISKAMIYNVLGMQDSALNILEEALIDFPRNGEMKYDVALLYAEQGDTARFHNLMEDAFKTENMDYEDKMQILVGYIKNLPVGSDQKAYEESDRLFRYADSFYHDDVTFLEIYGDYEVAKGDYKSTYEIMKRALALEPDDPYILGRTMSFSLLSDKSSEGIKLFDSFPETDGKKSYGNLMVYIALLQHKEEYQKALAWTDTLISGTIKELTINSQLDSEQADSLTAVYDETSVFNVMASYEVAGDLYSKMNMPSDVVRSYENSILLSKDDNPSVLNNYAYYLIETIKATPGSEDFEKAKEMSKKSIELSQKNPQANYYDTYAWILFKEGNYKEALDYQELAMEIVGSELGAEILSHYGDILFMSGRPEDALIQWTKALEYEPDNSLLKKKVEHKTFFYE